jgi:hypothetical protein
MPAGITFAKFIARALLPEPVLPRMTSKGDRGEFEAFAPVVLSIILIGLPVRLKKDLGTLKNLLSSF